MPGRLRSRRGRSTATNTISGTHTLVRRHPAGRVAVPQRRRGQFTSVRYGDRLAEIGAVASIGSIGDSFDNVLAETVNGYYKAD